jgi:hypothetical protein
MATGARKELHAKPGREVAYGLTKDQLATLQAQWDARYGKPGPRVRVEGLDVERVLREHKAENQVVIVQDDIAALVKAYREGLPLQEFVPYDPVCQSKIPDDDMIAYCRRECETLPDGVSEDVFAAVVRLLKANHLLRAEVNRPALYPAEQRNPT